MKPLIIILKTLLVGYLWSIVFIDGIRVLLLINWHFDILLSEHWRLLGYKWNSGAPISNSEIGFFIIVVSSIPLWLAGWVGLCLVKWENFVKKVVLSPLYAYRKITLKTKAPVVVKKKSIAEEPKVVKKTPIIKKAPMKRPPLPSATLLQSNINNIENMFTGNIVINRVKVPRNDGTNLADYLLQGISVSSIAMDGAGRKWFGTTTSGIYLVSADGTEILEHFTTENSYLPSNLIFSVECNTDNNSVYITTDKGLAEYSSDAVTPEQNFDNVYAYPNPVRPDYTGYITIRGLMENSLVKIADTAGNVVFSTKSNGGMAVWDGCNSNGKRVDTGVYFVFASQSEDGSSEGCVTKILIVR